MIAATSPSCSSSARSTASASLNGQHDRGRDDLGEHAARERVLGADALGGRDHVHRHRVVPAVVAALELDHVAPAGRRAREPEGMERRLAARAGEQHLLERRHGGDEPLGELDLDLGDADPHQADRAACGGRGGVDIGVVVPEERRPEGGVVVGVGAAVAVGERRAARRRDDQLLEPGNAALAAVDAAGDDAPTRAGGEEGGGFGGGQCSSADSKAFEHVLVEVDAEARVRSERRRSRRPRSGGAGR